MNNVKKPITHPEGKIMGFFTKYGTKYGTTFGARMVLYLPVSDQHGFS
jgi:hypothetical protein